MCRRSIYLQENHIQVRNLCQQLKEGLCTPGELGIKINHDSNTLRKCIYVRKISPYSAHTLQHVQMMKTLHSHFG